LTVSCTVRYKVSSS